MLVFASFVPHPPLILPNVGSPADRARVKKTITALEKLGRQLAKTKPDTIIISSPHPDWGFEVPLFFLTKNIEHLKFNIYDLKSLSNLQSSTLNLKSKIWPFLTTAASPQKHFLWGKKIAAGLPRTGRVVWIASGDLSHRLLKNGPYGLHPSGPKFDKKFVALLKQKDIQGILNLSSRLVEEAGECGLRSFCMLLGALDSAKTAWQPKILSYEGPFGVGYLVARLL